VGLHPPFWRPKAGMVVASLVETCKLGLSETRENSAGPHGRLQIPIDHCHPHACHACNAVLSCTDIKAYAISLQNLKGCRKVVILQCTG
jgi:hypothetical protein